MGPGRALGCKHEKESPYFLSLLAFFLCLLLAPQLNGQATGSLSGRITNIAGARIANARVTIKDAASGETKIVATKQDGSFTFSNLSSGVFELMISAPSFADAGATV